MCERLINTRAIHNREILGYCPGHVGLPLRE